MSDTKDTRSTRDTKESPEEELGRRGGTWVDVGHLAPLAAGQLTEAGWTPNLANKVYVYADNGQVVTPQPPYPEQPDVPEDGVPLEQPDVINPTAPKAAPKAEPEHKGR